MELFEAIHGRQTIKQVKGDDVPRELIEKILSAAAQAPNHYKVRPWRFVVLTGDARKKLGDVMSASFLERNPAAPPEGLDKTRALPLRAPVVIAVAADKPSEPKVIEIENISAASAAAYIILLAASSLGLGAIWRTGEWARD
ncbi:MAG: nitroreductase family protein, partial [Anaerolineales bacterium]